MPPTLAALRDRLARIAQEHLLTFHDRLTPPEQDALRTQIASIDLDAVPAWVETYVRHKPAPAIPSDPSEIEPARFYPWDGHDQVHPEARALGERLLASGKVAAFVVAGGQGSRLGFEGPKGCFPATAITKKPLFQLFAEQLLAARKKYTANPRPVPWYIMTSPLNHAATLMFFEERSYFGLGRENVFLFPQGVMPSFDVASGKILLASTSQVATNPDGHGGAITALHRSGALADMRARSIEHLSYFQVDNPHARILDPVFLGLHAGAPDSSAEMSSKMVRKASWDEKVGVFCQIGSRLDVIEYSDLPPACARATNPDGTLRFAAGSIAIHILGVNYLHRLATDLAFSLPFHRAEKKVAHIDLGTGKLVTPTNNNAVKLERFVFDALALAKNSIVYETDRVEEFAPIKNASAPDATDSLQTSQHLQTKRAARWLAAAGVRIPTTPSAEPDCIIEMSPLTACDARDVGSQRLPREIKPNDRVLL